MSSYAKYCHFSIGSHKGGQHAGGHHSGHVTSHREGSHMSHHGGSSVSHHGGSHMTHHGGHHTSHHGGHHFSHHGGSHKSSHGGHHMAHHGGSHMTHHGGHHKSYHGGSHLSHHGGHLMSHHGGHHMSSHGVQHMSNHGGSLKSHNGGHYMTHHGGSPMSHHGNQHTSHHGGSKMSHHGGSHMSNLGGQHMSQHGCHRISHHGGHHVSHHGSHHKKEVSFSKHVSHGHEGHHRTCGGHGGWKSDSLFGVNEKETMKLLNERLSSYLNKVRSLEMENAQLEIKISEWYANHQPKTPPDGTHYFRLIDDLQNQIAGLAIENSKIHLETDNARLAADDLNSKSEIEEILASNVEMDVKNLGRVLEGLSGEATELGIQVESFQEEVDSLRNNSEEEIESLLSQLGARVNVELNAAPSIDLNNALSEIREEYENLMERNLGETGKFVP